MPDKVKLHPKLTECKLCKSYYNHNFTPHPTYKQCCVIQCSICLMDTVIKHATKNCSNNTAPILAKQSFPLPHVWIDG